MKKKNQQYLESKNKRKLRIKETEILKETKQSRQDYKERWKEKSKREEKTYRSHESPKRVFNRVREGGRLRCDASTFIELKKKKDKKERFVRQRKRGDDRKRKWEDILFVITVFSFVR